jgi:hypothetical protein
MTNPSGRRARQPLTELARARAWASVFLAVVLLAALAAPSSVWSQDDREQRAKPCQAARESRGRPVITLPFPK